MEGAGEEAPAESSGAAAAATAAGADLPADAQAVSDGKATQANVRSEAVPPVFSLAPPADDSSDDALDEDGLPPMSGTFGYWSQMLNVTKVAEPLPPPPPKAAATPRSHKGSSKGDSWRGGAAGTWKGAGKASWKSMSRAPLNTNSVGNFMEWAKDPDAADGRERSRSPRREQGAERLESFMSWAQEDDEIAPKEEQCEDSSASGGGLGGFLAWASAEGGRGDSVKPERGVTVKAEERDRGEDALKEKEERRLADEEASDDEAASKRPRTSNLPPPKAEAVSTLPPPKVEAEDAVKDETEPGISKAEKEESDDDLDIAAMQRFRRLDADSDDDKK